MGNGTLSSNQNNPLYRALIRCLLVNRTKLKMNVVATYAHASLN